MLHQIDAALERAGTKSIDGVAEQAFAADGDQCDLAPPKLKRTAERQQG